MVDESEGCGDLTEAGLLGVPRQGSDVATEMTVEFQELRGQPTRGSELRATGTAPMLPRDQAVHLDGGRRHARLGAERGQLITTSICVLRRVDKDPADGPSIVQGERLGPETGEEPEPSDWSRRAAGGWRVTSSLVTASTRGVLLPLMSCLGTSRRLVGKGLFVGNMAEEGGVPCKRSQAPLGLVGVAKARGDRSVEEWRAGREGNLSRHLPRVWSGGTPEA